MALPLLEVYDRVVPLLDARKREVYAAVYAAPSAATPPLAGAQTIVAPCAMPAREFLAGPARDALAVPAAVVVGSGALHYRDDVERLAPDAVLPDPLDVAPPVAHLARIAHRLEPLAERAVRALEPDYVRSSEAELKRLKER